MSTQPFLIPNAMWVQVKDGNPIGRAIFGRHYTYRRTRDQMSLFPARNRNYSLFCGPGQKMVLLTPDNLNLFVWRKFKDDCIPKQDGINCAVFRREGGSVRGSDLIRAADDFAWARWPGERLYTYVDASRVKSSNPGWVFIAAGWRVCGRTKGGLRILECLP